MPRFYIHIENGNGDQPDATGSEFASANVAIAETARMAGELLREEAHDRSEDHRMRFRVVNEDQVLLATIRIELSFGL